MPDFGTQPSHTFIEGAHRFTARRTRELGDQALAALDRWAPDAGRFATMLQGSWAPELAEAAWSHVRQRLETQPIEDFRIDFEDGYGFRPDEDEDRHAISAARACAAAAREGTLPPYFGIRVKPCTPELRKRSLHTTTLFVRTLIESAGAIPGRLVINLAKVVSAVEVEQMAEHLDHLESELSLGRGALAMEMMLETPRAFLDPDGRSPLPAFVHAAGARLRGACFGPYDFTASIGVAPHEQRLGHPACDAARQAMIVAYGGSPLWLADGSTSVLPVPPTGGADQAVDASHVAYGWRTHYEDVRRSLRQAFYQGWDVHGAQLATRWTAVYVFYKKGFAQAAPRLHGLLQRASESTRLGAVFDDPATGESLLRFVRRAANAGVINAQELATAGLVTGDERARDFAEIRRSRLG